MRVMFNVAAGLLCAVASLGLLFWAYPWSIYYGNFTFAYGITLRSYVIMALLIGALVWIAMSISSRFLRLKPSTEALFTGLVTIFALILISLMLGPSGANIPETRISGIFFSEFKFMNFIADVALPSSCSAGEPPGALQRQVLAGMATIAEDRARNFRSWLKREADLRGYRTLRDAIAEYLSTSRGVLCTAKQIAEYQINRSPTLEARIALFTSVCLIFELRY